MRLGVLDIGSNTVHLLVVDGHRGARPLPAYSHKTELRLAEFLDDAGAITKEGARRLEDFVTGARQVADDKGVEQLLAFATSALREASNGKEILRRVADSAGTELQVLPGEAEAQLTFLAVRRWFGWSAGRLLVLDIGGGSLEVANGLDELPDATVSVPLGAGRLTREWLRGDPPKESDVKALRKHVRAALARDLRDFVVCGQPDRAVATSKTFKQLARIAGAAPSSEGIEVRRVLRHDDLQSWLPKLATMTTAERAELPGVSAGRAAQLVAGAVVADAAMDLLEVSQLELCPWALREGIILRALDEMRDDLVPSPD